MSGSSIMEANSFSGAFAEGMDEDVQQLVERRQKVMGGAYRLFYREPVHLVRGRGARLWMPRVASTSTCTTTSRASGTATRR